MASDQESCGHWAITELPEFAYCDDCLDLMPTMDEIVRMNAVELDLGEED